MINWISCLILTANVSLSQSQNLEVGKLQISAQISELFDNKTLKSFSEVINANDMVTWEMYVPESYKLNSSKAGLLVYISPTRTGKIPNMWISLMEKNNLIWISANQSGNNIDPRKRLIYSILAAQLIDKKYEIDLNRVYVSGLSGGGRMASIAATKYPQLFKGAIYNCGVNFWGDISKETIGLIKKNRFVFITGRQDFNLQDTRKVYAKYKKAGVKNIKLMINPTMGHFNPNKKDFGTAIDFLDDNNL